MLAWHFLAGDKRLGYGDGRLVEVGQTLECKGDPALCSNGMHGSARLIDAVYYARGPIVCRVEIDGDVIEEEDKLCGRRRTVLWMVDATQILHEFACRCAEDALALVAHPDPRSVEAIEAKRKWLRGEITAAAWEAAWTAAWAAAWAAARDASYTAWDPALDAAWDPAWAAALTAARGAALTAARGAARDASWAAAWAAARDASDPAWAAASAAARDKQNERLTAMVMEAHENEGV